MKRILTSCCLLVAEVLTAESVPDWENPEVNSINRLPARTYTVPLADERTALSWDLEPESPYVKSLNGDWKISWCGEPSQRPLDFWKTDFDDSGWETVDVPSCVELRGFGTPGYTNVRYPFALRFPRILDRQTGKPDYNPVSSYRTRFTVPESWKDRRVILRFDGVYSAYYVWVNGRKVGYAEDSKLPSEFDITPYLNLSTSQQSQPPNLLCVEVYRWCDGSYLEDQDMFRFSGIFRDVTLWSMPTDGIWDFTVKTLPVGDSANWKLEVKVEGEGEQRTEVSLYDAGMKKVADLHCSPSPLTFTSTLAARAWSAEDPYLYTLVVKRGSDVRAKKIGFRDVRITPEGVLTVNGAKVKFRGVNRHEHSAVNGRTVSLKEMTDDIVLMKRYNVNTVRTSHYPDHRLWYDLCDRYGIYLCAEANVEAHEDDYKTNNAGQIPGYRTAIVERNRRHVETYRNHPSVTIWSLGNECGHGTNFVDAAAAVRAADPQGRPTHWERGNQDADIDSKMYAPVEWLAKRAAFATEGTNKVGLAEWTGSVQRKGHPVFMAEYAHAMGNAVGNFEEYWQGFYASDVLSGGCIWDWVDQALVRETGRVGPDGKRETVRAYGGDWDEEPNDGPFCCNGLIRPDRRPTAKLVEVAHVHRGVRTALKDGKVEIWNVNSFTPTSAYDCDWELVCDGVRTASGQWEGLPSVAPWARACVDLPVFGATKGETFLNVFWRLRADTRWAKKGWIVARDQLAVANVGTCPPSPPHVAGPAVAVREAGDVLTVSACAGRTELAFSRRAGTAVALTMGGRRILADLDGLVSGPRLTVMRAFVDNDGWMKDGPWGENREREAFGTFGLTQLAYHPRPLRVKENADGSVAVTAEVRVCGRKSGGYDHCAVWTVWPDGRISIDNRTRPFGTQPPALPRFGTSWRLDGVLENVAWYGRGPCENYVDRRTGSFIGRYKSTVTDLYEDYVRPQDNGYRSDVRSVEFADDKGCGVRFTFTRPMFVQALHYGWEDLEFARHRRGEHRVVNMKPPRKEICLNLDVGQTGLGGGSCGPATMEKYRYAPQAEQWSVEIEACGDVELPFASSIGGPVPREKMQEVVQKLLDEGVAAGWQSCAQCCVYIDGEKVVDAWAGVMDKETRKPIDGDTLLPVFSTEKPILATAMHIAHDRGLVAYDDLVSKYWPEFTGDGKEKLTIRQLLGHRAGMPSGFAAFKDDLEKFTDWDFMAKVAAVAKPVCTPGTKTGYLSQSYAWYVGVPLTRIFGKPINDLLTDEVLRPAGIDRDFYFAVPESEFPRCATVYADNPNDGFLRMNIRELRAACIPSAYAAASARGLAKFYVRLAGMDGKPPLIRPETLAEASRSERWEKEPLPSAEELVNTWQMVFALGWGVWGDPDDLGRIIGQGGVGGSEGYGDVRNRIAIGYTCGTSIGSPRHDLRPAIYRACGVRTRHMPRPLYKDTKLSDDAPPK